LKIVIYLNKGDLKNFDIELNKNKKLWIKRGVYFNFEKLRNLVYRNLFKKIFLIV